MTLRVKWMAVAIASVFSGTLSAQTQQLHILALGKKKITVFSGGNANSTFCISSGSIWSWGDNSFGQLGITGKTYTAEPARTAVQGQWTSVASGSLHTIALNADGEIWAWGDNQFGQCGDGTIQSHTSPMKIAGPDKKWVSMAASDNQAFAISADGSLWAWGLNNYGQLGLGYISEYVNHPVQIGNDHDWKEIAAGSFHTIALKKDGSLWAWGAGNDGQLGTGNYYAVAFPVQAGKDTDWVSVAAAAFRSFAIKKDGSLWAWGSGDSGELGLAQVTKTAVPTKTGNQNWKQVSAGFYHTAAINAAGELWAWGNNDSGQLGLGHTGGIVSSPKNIGGAFHWKQITSGSAHTLAIRADDAVFAWGQNDYGQLGTGDYNAKPAPSFFADQRISSH